jgi:hypothetical protein
MTDNEGPPQWAMDRARELVRAQCQAQGVSVAFAADIFHPERHPAVKVLAGIIATHEKPPVDPDLEIAREALALTCEGHSNPGSAAMARAGEYDDTAGVTAARHALRLARERGVL